MLSTPLFRRLLLIFLSGSCLLGCDTAEKMQRHEECQTRLAEAEKAQARTALALEALKAASTKRDDRVETANRLVKLANEPSESEAVRMEWARAKGEADAAVVEFEEARKRAEREVNEQKVLGDAAAQFCAQPPAN